MCKSWWSALALMTIVVVDIRQLVRYWKAQWVWSSICLEQRLAWRTRPILEWQSLLQVVQRKAGGLDRVQGILTLLPVLSLVPQQPVSLVLTSPHPFSNSTPPCTTVVCYLLPAAWINVLQV